METINSWVSNPDEIIALVIKYGGSLILAIITLIIGLWLIGKLTKGPSHGEEWISLLALAMATILTTPATSF